MTREDTGRSKFDNASVWEPLSWIARSVRLQRLDGDLFPFVQSAGRSTPSHRRALLERRMRGGLFPAFQVS